MRARSAGHSFTSADDPSAAENDTDHRIKMYKELRRVGGVAFNRRPATGGDMSPSDAPEAPGVTIAIASGSGSEAGD